MFGEAVEEDVDLVVRVIEEEDGLASVEVKPVAAEVEPVVDVPLVVVEAKAVVEVGPVVAELEFVVREVDLGPVMEAEVADEVRMEVEVVVEVKMEVEVVVTAKEINLSRTAKLLPNRCKDGGGAHGGIQHEGGEEEEYLVEGHPMEQTRVASGTRRKRHRCQAVLPCWIPNKPRLPVGTGHR